MAHTHMVGTLAAIITITHQLIILYHPHTQNLTEGPSIPTLGGNIQNYINKPKEKKKKSLQHLLFPGRYPSKYWARPTLLNFGDWTRTGAFSVVWL